MKQFFEWNYILFYFLNLKFWHKWNLIWIPFVSGFELRQETKWLTFVHGICINQSSLNLLCICFLKNIWALTYATSIFDIDSIKWLMNLTSFPFCQEKCFASKHFFGGRTLSKDQPAFKAIFDLVRHSRRRVPQTVFTTTMQNFKIGRIQSNGLNQVVAYLRKMYMVSWKM